MDDLAEIRRAAQEGQPVLPAQVLALCDEVERAEAEATEWRGQASRWADNIDALTTERDALLVAGQAWAAAIGRQDIAEIERCANELILAVARCN